MLARQFLVRTQQDIGRLREFIDRAAFGEWTLLTDAARLCHSIHGAAAMFGYPQLSQAAHALQNLMQDLVLDSTTLPTSKYAATSALVDSADKLARALVESAEAKPAARCMFRSA
jgi:HPt (histidine-containing phosphotransfer) domain-containing protein